MAGDAGETWDPWGSRHPWVSAADVSPLTFLSTLSFGSDVADLPGGPQDAGDTSRSHGAVWALLPRWTRGSWWAGGAHGTGSPQGSSLGAHGHLRQLLLQHLQHHVDDVLVPGVPARYAPLAGHPRHAALPDESSGARRTRVAPHTRCARVPRGAGEAELALDTLLPLWSRLARFTLLALHPREAVNAGVTDATFGASFPWGALVSFDSWQALGSWDSWWPLLTLGPRSALLPGGTHEATLTPVTLWPGDTLRSLLAPGSGFTQLPRGTGDAWLAPSTHFALISWATFASRLARQTSLSPVSRRPRAAGLSCAALHAGDARGAVLAIDAWETVLPLGADVSLGSPDPAATQLSLLARLPWRSSGAFPARPPGRADGPHHPLVASRTRLALGSCHPRVAPLALWSWRAWDALLSGDADVTLGTLPALLAGLSQGTGTTSVSLQSLQSLGALGTRRAVGRAQEISAALQSLDVSWGAGFSWGAWGTPRAVGSWVTLGSQRSDLPGESNLAWKPGRSWQRGAGEPRWPWESGLALQSWPPHGSRLPFCSRETVDARLPWGPIGTGGSGLPLGTRRAGGSGRAFVTVNAIRSRHSWRTGGATRARLSWWPSELGQAEAGVEEQREPKAAAGHGGGAAGTERWGLRWGLRGAE